MAEPFEKDLLDDSSSDSIDVKDIERANLLTSDNDHDVEKTTTQVSSPPSDHRHEHTVPLQRKLLYLLGYFLCNVGLTIYNKAVLGSFKFPWLLTALHAGSSSIGCFVMLQLGSFQTSKLTRRENLALVAFSFVFTINIAISNVSLAMVSVPFHQVVRATTPLFTTLLYRFIYARTFSTATYLSLIPIIFGVALTTYGDYKFSDLGFILTFLGVLLAAFKTVVTNRMMTGSLALSFWEILLRMSPLACIQSIAYAAFTGELTRFRTFVQQDVSALPPQLGLILAGNGFLAFLLNVSSFSTNKVAGALTMTVCANIKQCLTIVLGIVLFDVHLSSLNACGIAVTIVGGVFYSLVELDSRRRSKG